MALDLLGAAGVGAGGEGEEAAVNQSAAKLPRPVAVKSRWLAAATTVPVPRKAGSARSTLAAGIAEVGIAAVLEEAALGLLQVVRQAAHLGGEGEARAAHLAERAGAHQDALAARPS